MKTFLLSVVLLVAAVQPVGIEQVFAETLNLDAQPTTLALRPVLELPSGHRTPATSESSCLPRESEPGLGELASAQEILQSSPAEELQQTPGAESETRVRGKKSPALALALSVFVPGLGQHYNGEHVKGAVQEILFAGGAAMCFASLIEGIFGGMTGNVEGWTEPVFYSGAIISLGSYTWSVVDAPLSASRINRESATKQLGLMKLRLRDDASIVRVGILPGGAQIVISSQF
jgi:TM2 domain-containing membrane protein YozV